MIDQLIALASMPEAWAALATLIVMEVVLGIDNLIFLSILTNKLPEHQRASARYIGLGLALFMRLGLLFTITIIIGLTQPLFTLFGNGFSWRDLILIAGGLFLVYKATREIHESVDPHEGEPGVGRAAVSYGGIIVQIIVIDLVFSLDSIITAVGMTEHLPIMVISVIFAIVVMVIAAGPLADFIKANPTIVMLALSFLLMIGMILIADGFGFKVPKGYVYAAMAFSIAVEALNMWVRRSRSRIESTRREAQTGTPPITQRAKEQIAADRASAG